MLDQEEKERNKQYYLPLIPGVKGSALGINGGVDTSLPKAAIAVLFKPYV